MTRDEIIGMAREAGFGVAASMPGLIEALSRLRAERDALRTELDALKAWKEEAEKQEPVAWRTFDGEGGYDYRGVDDNEDYRDEFIERNPRYANWVDALYLHPVPPAHSVPEGWQTVPKEVADLYGFMCSAFVPMTGQQEEIAKQLDLAKQAMKAEPKPEVK